MTKNPNKLVSDFDFGISDLSAAVVSHFELRISDFDPGSLGVLARYPPTLKLRRIPRSLGEGENVVEVVLLNIENVRI